jgi:hypothetical protein
MKRSIGTPHITNLFYGGLKSSTSKRVEIPTKGWSCST